MIILELNEPVECRWFLTCTYMTLQAAEHPICGYVPICARCRAVVDDLPSGSLIHPFEIRG